MGILRDNLEPTDFANAELRVSEWSNFGEYGIKQCRIWLCRCGPWWFQRHEWQYDGRNSTELDPWILHGFCPRKNFDAHMKPVKIEAIKSDF